MALFIITPGSGVFKKIFFVTKEFLLLIAPRDEAVCICVQSTRPPPTLLRSSQTAIASDQDLKEAIAKKRACHAKQDVTEAVDPNRGEVIPFKQAQNE